MSGGLVAGVVAGYGVALPIGPIGTYLVSLGARERFRVAAAGALGVATTDGVYAAIAAVGGARLHSLLRPVSGPLTYASVVALLVLAVRTLATAVRRYRTGTEAGTGRRTPLRPRHAYLALVAVTALNPSTLAYFSALVLGSRSGASGMDALLFPIGAFVASASWQLVLAGSGKGLGTLLTGRRGQLVVAGTSSAIMVALAARLLVS